MVHFFIRARGGGGSRPRPSTGPPTEGQEQKVQECVSSLRDVVGLDPATDYLE